MAPPSRNDDSNRRIDHINQIVAGKCPGKPVITLDLADESGRVRPEFTTDGVHLGPKAYQQWKAKIRHVDAAEAAQQP